MILIRQAEVYYAPTRRRRYFTLDSAISAEATAIIHKHHPIESEDADPDTGYPGFYYNVMMDESERFDKVHARLCKILKRQLAPTVNR